LISLYPVLFFKHRLLAGTARWERRLRAGGDYTLETLDQDERRAVEQAGGKIVIIPLVPGKSTTALLEKISRL